VWKPIPFLLRKTKRRRKLRGGGGTDKWKGALGGENETGIGHRCTHLHVRSADPCRPMGTCEDIWYADIHTRTHYTFSLFLSVSGLVGLVGRGKTHT
jgi:hypothetical protein